MIDEGKDKEISNAEIILNAITVEEAITTFRRIENWIGDILHSSEEDFLALNKQFKTYHKESRNISENVLHIIQSLTDHELTLNFQSLNNIVKGFSQLSSEFTNRIENYEIELKKTLNKIENLKIIFQNLRQVIISTPLLLVNVKVQQDDFDFNVLKDLIKKAEDIIQQFISISQENLNLLSDIKKDNYAKLQRLNDNIEIGFELFQRKHQEANAFSKELKEKAENNNTYVSSIITNLQYHDIIRQKVEHIQRTHQDILNDLEKFMAQPNDNSQIHNKAKTYIKIRDISGLQAAQLIHANNQYHISIQEIFHGLEEIGNNMIAINSMCENLVGKSGQSKKYYLEIIMDNLKGALDYTHNLIILSEQLAKKINQLKDIVHLLKLNNTELAQKTDSIFLIISEKISDPTDPFLQELNSLNKESKSYVEHINAILNELSNKIQYFYSLISEFIEDGNLLQSFSELKQTIPDLLNLLEKSIKDVDEFLNLNSNISQKISNEVLNTIDHVKYYDFFEKTCNKIIEELNILNIRLNYGYELSEKEREENLKILKTRYTMASEHLIHDQLSQMQNISEVIMNNSEKIIEIANQNSDPNDDNLELF